MCPFWDTRIGRRRGGRTAPDPPQRVRPKGRKCGRIERQRGLAESPMQSAAPREGVLPVFNDNGSFLLALFEFFVFVAWFMCLFWIFGDLFRSRDLGGGGKTVWALFIIILPIVGTLVYLIARGNGMTERGLQAQADAQKRQEEYIRS